MANFTLSIRDLEACIEIASDGLAMHLDNQEKLEVIHKIMYAVAEATQSPHIPCHQKNTSDNQYSVHLNTHRHSSRKTLVK